MSKAEERALERYPDYKGMYGRYVTQINKRKVFTEGYHQAEKDNALTWKDMKLIYEISCDVFNEHDGDFYNVSKIWKEVLKRFNDMFFH